MAHGSPAILERMKIPVETWQGMSQTSKEMTLSAFTMFALRQNPDREAIVTQVEMIDLQIETGLWWMPVEHDA